MAPVAGRLMPNCHGSYPIEKPLSSIEFRSSLEESGAQKPAGKESGIFKNLDSGCPFRGHPDFQPSGDAGHTVGKGPIHHRDEEVHFKGTEISLANGLSGFSQIHHPDDRGQGSILKEDDELGD